MFLCATKVYNYHLHFTGHARLPCRDPVSPAILNILQRCRVCKRSPAIRWCSSSLCACLHGPWCSSEATPSTSRKCLRRCVLGHFCASSPPPIRCNATCGFQSRAAQTTEMVSNPNTWLSSFVACVCMIDGHTESRQMTALNVTDTDLPSRHFGCELFS